MPCQKIWLASLRSFWMPRSPRCDTEHRHMHAQKHAHHAQPLETLGMCQGRGERWVARPGTQREPRIALVVLGEKCASNLCAANSLRSPYVLASTNYAGHVTQSQLKCTQHVALLRPEPRWHREGLCPIMVLPPATLHLQMHLMRSRPVGLNPH